MLCLVADSTLTLIVHDNFQMCMQLFFQDYHRVDDHRELQRGRQVSVCYICGEGNEVGNPNYMMGYYSCGQVEQQGRSTGFARRQCQFYTVRYFICSEFQYSFVFLTTLTNQLNGRRLSPLQPTGMGCQQLWLPT